MTSCRSPRMILSALTSPKADELPMSLMPSSTITNFTPVWASTSRSNRASALGPKQSCKMQLPAIPWFSTPTLLWWELNRLASSSGQRWLLPWVDPSPSVIESPSAAIAFMGLDALTSTPPKRNHDEKIAEQGAPLSLAVESPDARYDIPPKVCVVAGPA